VFNPPFVVLGSEYREGVVDEDLDELVLHLFRGGRNLGRDLLCSLMALVLCSQDLNQVRLDHLPDVDEVDLAMFIQETLHSDLPLDEDDYRVTVRH
jgi:hypothetical protein